MPLEIAVKQGQQTMESMGSFDDLEDALTEFNELINRRNWHQSVTTISLTDTDKNKCLAQYALQEFNHSEDLPHEESQPQPRRNESRVQ